MRRNILLLMLSLLLGCNLMLAQEGVRITNTETPLTEDEIVEKTDSLYAALASSKIQPDEAIQPLSTIIAQSKKLHFNKGVIKGFNVLGAVYSFKTDYAKSLSAFQQALKYCDSTDSTRYIYSTIYINIAGTYKTLGDYENAMLYYNKALDITLWLPGNPKLETVYLHIGLCFLVMEQHNKAIYYLKKAERLFTDSVAGKAVRTKMNLFARQEKLSNIQLTIGEAYYAVRDTTRAEAYLRAAYKSAGDILYNKLAVLVVRAELCRETGRPEEALRLLKEASGLNMKIDSGAIVLHTMNLSFGRTYLQLKDYEKAEAYFKSVLKYAAASKSQKSIAEAHQALAGLYAAKGDYTQAYYHKVQEKYNQDSVLTKEKSNAINLMETRFRTAEKDREIAVNKLLIENKEQQLTRKNIIIGLTAAGVMLLIVLIIILYRNYKNRRKLDSSRIQLLEQQQKIVEMKSIMNGEESERTRIARELHDSIMIQFSAAKMNLSAFIGSHANGKEMELKAIQRQLDDATVNLRNTAHNLMPDMLLLEGLVAALDYFIDNCRQLTPLKIEFLHYGSIPRMDREFELTLYRVTQELVQNAIKHAQATRLIIQLNYREPVLTITVEDNGSGIKKDNHEHRPGMGLKSVQARVQAVNGTMEIESLEGQGVTVLLEFDVATIAQLA